MLIKVRIGADMRLPLRGASPDYAKFIQRLEYALTFPDPRYSKARQQGRRPAKGIKEYIQIYRKTKKVLIAPSGAFVHVESVARQFNAKVTYINKTVVNKGSGIPYEDQAVQLRPYQVEAAQKFERYRRMVLQASCGAGKTATGTAFALNSGEATLVLTHSTDLLKQWVGCFEWLSKGKTRVRIISSGAKDTSALLPGEVCVATIQSLSRDPKKYKDVLESAGICLIDECHHASSPTWRKVIDKIPARYRIGLTATPRRSDDIGFMTDYVIGRVYHRITSIDLLDMGFLKRPIVYPIHSPFKPTEADYFYSHQCDVCCRGRKALSWKKFQTERCKCGRPLKKENLERGKINFAALQTTMGNDPYRLTKIVDITEASVKAGRKTLLLLPRAESVSKAVDMLQVRGVEAYALVAKTKKNDRDRILNSVRFGSGQVVVAVKIAEEGLDLPNLSTMIVASGGKFSGNSVQRIGRIARMGGAAIPVLIDIVDDHGMLQNQAKHRVLAYRSAYGDCIRRTSMTVEDCVYRLTPFLEWLDDEPDKVREYDSWIQFQANLRAIPR